MSSWEDFSGPSEVIAAEIFLEDTFWFSLRTHVVAFMVEARFPRSSFAPPLVVYLFCDTSGDAASSATAAAAGEVLIPGMVQAPLRSPSLVTTTSLNAPGSQPEALLRSVSLCEQLITAFRVQDVADRELFVALDTPEESLRETCKEAFGIDSSKGFAHKRELGKIVTAWNNAKVHNDTKLKLDAVARAHGEPVSRLCSDWEDLIFAFKAKFGTHLHDTALPAQSYFEGFEERLAEQLTNRSRKSQMYSAI